MINPNAPAKLSETCESGTQITYDAGAIDQIPSLIGDRQYCVVICGGPFFAALTDTLAGNSHPPVIVIDDVVPNPDFALLATQAARFASLPVQPEVILALGGGSVIDTAKVLASANGGFANVETFLVSNTGEENLTAIPIIAVPTTAGTGSEVTCWATVWDNSSKKKYSLNRPALYPEHAVIDPELMLGKSRALTISTGLDALSHALESIWNVNASEASARCAVNAALEILEVLPMLVEDPGSLELRARMAGASLMSGMAFSKTKTAIAHSISWPISLHHNVIHGIACSFTLPIVLKSMAGDEGLCGKSLKQIFGEDLSSAPRQMTDFLTSLGVSTHPKDHGVSPEEWVGIVDQAFMGGRGLNFIGT
ncbi:phosphonoacetaldehyde reductase [Candidatus Halocynthiibacter alkanivorans]|uniref:phosphonoacetaldehyde reductase n=1 Tax=Candidatus Halocynthiibacter alkanivorans TaxID=2267619 RepID=UPI000DF48669|nr:phosphonoacetaldehyde reductase [Candidatus Halocynthiibacter alkanivorans]